MHLRLFESIKLPSQRKIDVLCWWDQGNNLLINPNHVAVITTIYDHSSTVSIFLLDDVHNGVHQGDVTIGLAMDSTTAQSPQHSEDEEKHSGRTVLTQIETHGSSASPHQQGQGQQQGLENSVGHESHLIHSHELQPASPHPDMHRQGVMGSPGGKDNKGRQVTVMRPLSPTSPRQEYAFAHIHAASPNVSQSEVK
jgi:hypothetical protein